MRQHLVSGLPSVGWLFLEAAHDECGKIGWHSLPILCHWLGFIRHMRCQYRLWCGAEKRSPAREELIRHDTQGVDVGTMVGVWIGHRLLGCHIRGRTKRNARGRECLSPSRFAHRFRHPEIRDDSVSFRQQHVVRLDVAMDHAMPVRRREGIHDVAQDPHRLADRQLSLTFQPLAQ